MVLQLIHRRSSCIGERCKRTEEDEEKMAKPAGIEYSRTRVLIGDETSWSAASDLTFARNIIFLAYKLSSVYCSLITEITAPRPRQKKFQTFFFFYSRIDERERRISKKLINLMGSRANEWARAGISQKECFPLFTTRNKFRKNLLENVFERNKKMLPKTKRRRGRNSATKFNSIISLRCSDVTVISIPSLSWAGATGLQALNNSWEARWRKRARLNDLQTLLMLIFNEKLSSESRETFKSSSLRRRLCLRIEAEITLTLHSSELCC